MLHADRVNFAKALRERLLRESRSSLLRFTMSTMPTFRPADFHRRYYAVLTDFAFGKIKKLMVFMPPQHGKSEGSTRRLPAFLVGINPDNKLAIVSYNAPKARKFNREIQRIIDTPEYHEIFPETNLNTSNVTTVTGSWLRNADECEIVGHRGGFKTVGVGGALTGEPVDILVMDDIYKDAKTAWSPTVRASVSDWYDTVAETRLHNDSQQLIVFTRWHEEDLAGKLLREQGVYDPIDNPTGWVVVVYQAIKEGEPNEYDPRQPGEALWPERHSREKLLAVKTRNPHVFESLYQQNPKPMEGLMYSQFKTYSILPTEKFVRRNYTDTADTGADYLCSVCYLETKTAMYVTDILLTKKPMEYTEPKTAQMLLFNRTEEAMIESNNGGRGFGRAVERIVREDGGVISRRMMFSMFHQGTNKDVRIFSHSAEVQNLIYYPEDWEVRWPEFANAVKGYRKEGLNTHDDVPDVLTGMCEYFGRQMCNLSDEQILNDLL